MGESRPAPTLSIEQARALCLAAQGFPAATGARLVPTLERSGFVRTLGGVDVYLALRARLPGMKRSDLDRAVERSEAQVVPSARGCIYLVSRRHVGLSLRIAALLTTARAEREHERAGIRAGEVGVAAGAVLETLRQRGPLTTDALRKALPEGAVRSLGDRGKKVGISSTLPPALRLLELGGRVERTPENGRLDRERYRWRIAAQDPFAGGEAPDDPAAIAVRLAAVFFSAAGLATAKELAAWSGLSQRDARAGIEGAGLVAVGVKGMQACAWRLRERTGAAAARGGSASVESSETTRDRRKEKTTRRLGYIDCYHRLLPSTPGGSHAAHPRPFHRTSLRPPAHHGRLPLRVPWVAGAPQLPAGRTP